MKDRIHSIGNKREKYPRVSAWRAFTSPRGRPGCGQAWDVCITGPAVYARWRVRGLQTADVAGVCVSRVSVCCAQRYRCCAAVRCAMCSLSWQLSVILSGAHQPRHTQTNSCLHLYLHPTTHILILFVLIYVDTKSLNETHTCLSRLNLTLNWD